MKKAAKPKTPIPEQPKVQMFTISFDIGSKALSFIGNISAEQAGELVKLIIQQQQKTTMRKEIESELAQAGEAQEKTQIGKEKAE